MPIYDAQLISPIGGAGPAYPMLVDSSGNLIFEPGVYADGPAGAAGTAGASAYDVAVAGGYVGNQTAWLASLRGATGDPGANGRSAYQVAVANGFLGGSVTAWLNSLQGANGTNGTNGLSPYAAAVAAGYTGSVDQWLLQQKGATGAAGTPSPDFAGTTPCVILRKSTTQASGALNVGTKLIFDAVDVNIGSAWDGVNNRFTPAVSGIYYLSLSIWVPESGGDSYAQIKKNGTVIAESGKGTKVVGAAFNISWIEYLNGSTDSIEFWECKKVTAAATNANTGNASAILLWNTPS